MTPADVLAAAAVAGVDVYLKPDGSPAVRGNPSAALLAALKEHRAGVIEQLGGDRPREWCGRCEAWIYQAEDSEAFCMMRKCEFRERARREDGPL